MEYYLGIGVELCIYIILLLSVNLTIGMANLLTLCQAAFYGIGAYAGALLLMNNGIPFIIISLLVMTVSGAISLIISYASMKLKGDYFILATLGFQFIVCSVLLNWTGVTGGAFALNGIPPIKLCGRWELDRLGLFIFSLIVTGIVIWFFARLQKSPYGRMLLAIRTNELSAQTLGRNTTELKMWAFFISAAAASLAGVIYASLRGSLAPEDFSLDRSILILTALFIGGIGTRVWGAIAGASIIVILPELLLRIGYTGNTAELRQIIVGVLLIIILFLRPRGLCGDMELK